MAESDQEMLARISRLAGQINRHKNQQAGIHSTPSLHPSHHRQNYYRHGAPSYRVGRPHRHRTLVLNGGTQTPPSTASEGATPSESSASWISKSDRHLQLINSTVYEKEAQSRNKAIEETRKQKLRQRDERETSRLMNHFNRQTGDSRTVATNSSTPGTFEVDVGGIRFRVVKNGRKLVKVAGDTSAPSDTPKVATIGGVKFHRSKNGNLYRAGVIKAQRQSGIVKKVNEPCKIFSSTGSCLKGSRCRYNHDASKVAVCKDFLQKESCVNGESCDLSHDLTPERTPTCLHFVKGNCSNSNCPYTHATVSPGALVCRSFGIYGYCDKGAQCTERHVWECPDFANTGKCKIKGCKLIHRERASVLRNQQREPNNANEIDDISSDDESADSDDVDSDEVEEFIGDGDLDDTDFRAQTDYIAFST